MMQEPGFVEEIVLRAGEWVCQQQAYILKVGLALNPHQCALARQVGVDNPEKIRLLEVDEIAAPEDALLRQIAQELNFLGPETLGITLGHGVYVRRGFASDRLLSHEFRHVYQYEAAGSIQMFIAEYLRQIMQFGYFDAPYEQDARRHEINITK